MPRIDQITPTKRPTPLRGFAFGLTSVVAGAALILVLAAATTYIEVSLANGTISNGATVVTSANSISGQAVLFGPSSTSTSTPAPSGTATPKSTPTPTPNAAPTPTPTNSSGGTPAAGGCTSGGVVAPCIGSATTGASGWGTPVFDNEFDQISSLDTSTWATSWFSGSTMNDVSTSPSNVSISGGDLVLTLSSSSEGALVDTNPKQASTGFQFGDGYFAEARIYFPGSSSTSNLNWPAFWADGQSWPTDGEDDIAEGLGTMTTNYHSPQGASNSGTIPGNWLNGWHTYALDRESGENYIYWDGKLVRSYATDDGGADQYLIFNVGCSGGCTTGAASDVKVAYVRVWKKQ